MSAVYLESSAILARLLAQPEGEGLIPIIDRAEIIFASVLSLVETRRSLIRLEKTGQMKGGEQEKLLGIFQQVSRGWIVSEITTTISVRAGQPFPIEPIRTLDALHLATGLELLKVYPDLIFLTLDKRVTSNLEALGFSPPGL